ncbi:hypothetical protein [Tropicimonas sediminicola]|uniref:Chaperone modulatory protein CbpM n=1 Tax=Tropicimonas sediminicola TaxID=1031541 RepID=A0A239EGA3_9RHOB|nr:hypothetical protein [Tropicimonas sediminicola]SNS43288.1 chaperone modulatory protein CbpM [Tropicimonas sediminicola]
MTTIYTEEQIIAEVPGLDRALLMRFVKARIVVPLEAPARPGPVFGQIDVARLQLACDLCESFDLEDDALDLLLRLVDQLHGVRAELHALVDALEALPEEQRKPIEDRIRRRLAG